MHVCFWEQMPAVNIQFSLLHTYLYIYQYQLIVTFINQHTSWSFHKQQLNRLAVQIITRAYLWLSCNIIHLKMHSEMQLHVTITCSTVYEQSMNHISFIKLDPNVMQNRPLRRTQFLKTRTSSTPYTSNIHQLRRITCVLAISLQEWVTQHGEWKATGFSSSFA